MVCKAVFPESRADQVGPLLHCSVRAHQRVDETNIQRELFH